MAHPCLPQLTTEKSRKRTAQSKRPEDSRSRAGCSVVPSRRAQPPFTSVVSASASERPPARPSERPRVPAAPRAGDFHGGRCVSEAPRTLSRRPAGCAPSPKLCGRKAAGIAVGLSLLIAVGGYPLWAVCLRLAFVCSYGRQLPRDSARHVQLGSPLNSAVCGRGRIRGNPYSRSYRCSCIRAWGVYLGRYEHAVYDW